MDRFWRRNWNQKIKRADYGVLSNRGTDWEAGSRDREFSPKQIADFMSEVLVLGVYAKQGVVLIQPERRVEKGDKLG